MRMMTLILLALALFCGVSIGVIIGVVLGARLARRVQETLVDEWFPDGWGV